MKKASRKRRVARKKKAQEIKGLIDSPIVKGLIGLIPLLVLATGVAGGVFFAPSEPRKIALEVGGVPSSALAHQKLVEVAAANGDLVLAEKEYYLGSKLLAEGEQVSKVLGVSTELEDLVWPEIRIEREIGRLTFLETGVESKQVYMMLARLYEESGDEESLKETLDKAASIDPNDEGVKFLEN